MYFIYIACVYLLLYRSPHLSLYNATAYSLLEAIGEWNAITLTRQATLLKSLYKAARLFQFGIVKKCNPKS